MSAEKNPPVRVTTEELLYLIEQELAVVKGAKIRSCVLEGLGKFHGDRKGY